LNSVTIEECNNTENIRNKLERNYRIWEAEKMSQSLLATVSKQLWRSHEQTKRLLSFFVPTSKFADTVNKEQREKEQQKLEVKSSDENQQGNAGNTGNTGNTGNAGGDDGKNESTYLIHQKIGLFAGPILFLLMMLFFSPEGLSPEGKAVLAITIWVATWWISEAIPIPATSLMPIFLLPLTGALPSGKVTAAYGDPNVFLFMGGFLIAIAMEKWNLHKRIALTIIDLMGTGTKQIILGFMIATGFLSMWISNTAAVMMMVPIGMAIAYQIGQVLVSSGEATMQDQIYFDKAIIIGIGYSGTIGGLGTLIGTPPLIILAANLDKIFGYQISFAGWMLFAMPIVALLLVGSWLYLVNIAFPMKIKSLPGGKKLIHQEKDKLGKASSEEKRVFAVFCFAAFMWITRAFFWGPDGLIYTIPNINDTMIAVFAGVLLFLIPAKEKGKFILDWTAAKELPWGILLLFGGGLAIASGFQESGLAAWIGSQLNVLEGASMLMMIIVTTILILVLTEFTSNTATATMILPILAVLALAINVHPLALMVPAVMAASLAFMMPVGTPPNAIIFSTGKISIGDMMRTGFWVNVVTIIVIVVAVYFYLPVAFDVDLSIFPNEWR